MKLFVLIPTVCVHIHMESIVKNRSMIDLFATCQRSGLQSQTESSNEGDLIRSVNDVKIAVFNVNFRFQRCTESSLAPTAIFDHRLWRCCQLTEHDHKLQKPPIRLLVLVRITDFYLRS